MPDLEAICYRIKKARKRTGWTLDEASEETGVNRASINEYERVRSPSFFVACILAKAYGVSLKWLATGRN